ncbi:MAG: polyprenyl synthetase family protein, partial [Planctomycetes bacterium]|nr:polyprenyl synthetase family protein [Planctomycetota bacterium]
MTPTGQRASDPVSGETVIAHLYAPIRQDLERVRAQYRKELTSNDPYIANLLKYIEDYSGKMLRPALLLLAGKACGNVTDDHVVLAAVAEMIHTATLVHDDILDDADIRRQRPSINRLAGREVTILLGDHLFSHALELALSVENPIGAHRFSRAVSRTCLGEITQVFNRGNLGLDEETYFRIVQGKTAELYATSAEVGAIYAGADKEGAAGLYDYGLNLG